jgi:hypothetical protein
MQTGADQGLELGCMNPAVTILSSSLSITSFLARGVLRAGSFEHLQPLIDMVFDGLTLQEREKLIDLVK